MDRRARPVPVARSQHAVRRVDAQGPHTPDGVRGRGHLRWRWARGREYRGWARPRRGRPAGGASRVSGRPPAILALEDGRVFRGEAFGALAETTGEVVFNTAMTGYQEVLSDPSYCGQIVTFTYPLMGNYGVNGSDWESEQIRAQAMVCREVCEVPSNWRAEGRLQDLLEQRGVPGICGIDTRALTRHLRDRGVMRGCLSALERDADALIEKARSSPSMLGLALADLVTCAEPWWWSARGPAETPDAADARKPLLAVMDFGVKFNILRRLHAEGFRVQVFPARTPAS